MENQTPMGRSNEPATTGTLGESTHPARPSGEDLARLAQLMRAMTVHSEEMERAYRALERQACDLARQVEEKNAALQEKVQALDRTTHFLNRVLDSVSEGLVALNGDWVITCVNDAAAFICGISAEELAGRAVDHILPAHVLDRIRPALKEGRLVEATETFVLGRCVTDHSSSVLIPVRLSVVPLRHQPDARNGTQTGGAGVLLQFADLREVRELEERARRSDRLRALGELAAGVAHEMRNPLTTIRGYVQLLPEEGNDPHFVTEMTGQVLSEIDRLVRLTENLLNLARPARATLEPVDLTAWLLDVVAFERDRLAHAGVLLAVQPMPTPGPVATIDQARMRQVLLNLLQNSAEAMPEGGSIRVGVRLEGDEDRRWAVIRVEDSGCGIAAEQLERIFDPFFTTKPDGSGLGLAITHRIVEEHLGHLRVNSELGKGTTVDVWLPLVGARKG